MLAINQVDGIYSIKDYDKLDNYLQTNYPQVALFWSIGCDTGYRVSDILLLKVSDIIDGQICIIERKTGKEKTATISDNTKSTLAAYVAENGLYSDSFIFWCGRHEKGVQPVSRQYIWRVIKQAGQALGLPRLSLEHIQRARHMRGVHSYPRLRLMQHRLPSTTVSSPPRLGMSKAEWNSFLRSLMAQEDENDIISS